MRGGDTLRQSEPRVLRLLGYASVVLAVIGLAAVSTSLWLRDRSAQVQAAAQATPSRSLPLVGAAPAQTRSVQASATVTPTATWTRVPPTVTASATPTPTATKALSATPSATPSPSPAPPTATPTLLTATPTSPTATPTPAIRSISEVLAALPGSRAVLQGTVVEISRFTSGVRCTLEDASGRVTLWLPQSVWRDISETEAWGIGCVVRAAGTVQLYKDEIELVPQQAAEVVLIASAPAAPVVRVGDLSSRDVGRQVAVQGTIVEVWPFSQGIKYLFDDGSGRIVVLLWQGVYNDVPGKEALVSGAVIRVSGMVQEYNGRLEIIPGLGHEITLQ